jgi:hypothetical protein
MPESPRWREYCNLQKAILTEARALIYPRLVVEHGRKDEGLANLKKIHADKSDPHASFAHREFDEIVSQIELEKTLPTSWMSILTIPSYRKRALIGFGVMFFAQCTGTQVINSEPQ